MMMAEIKLKDAHDALLHGDPDVGIELMQEAIVEIRIAIHSVRHMKGEP
jgi:hypothetical protein